MLNNTGSKTGTLPLQSYSPSQCRLQNNSCCLVQFCEEFCFDLLIKKWEKPKEKKKQCSNSNICIHMHAHTLTLTHSPQLAVHYAGENFKKLFVCSCSSFIVTLYILIFKQFSSQSDFLLHKDARSCNPGIIYKYCAINFHLVSPHQSNHITNTFVTLHQPTHSENK